MDPRFKSTVDMDNQVAGKKAAISLQFAPMESFIPAAVESVQSTSNTYYIHPASVSPVEGFPLVQSFLTPLDAGLTSRQQEFYIQQPNASSEGLIVLNSRPIKQDGLYSSRDDDRVSNLSEDAPSARVKLLCSYGGKILPRPSDGTLRYVGGETRMVTVNRDITFSSVMVKMVEIQPQTVSIKYQLPDEDLDALVSVSSEEDLDNMLEEYDKLEAGDHPRLRVFLFTAADYDAPAVADALSDAKNTEQQYLDAINGLSEAPVRKLSDVSTQSAASSMSGQPGVAASQGATFHEQVQQLQQLTQQAPVLVTQQLVPETVQVSQVAASARPEQDGMVWSSEAQNSTVYTAVGVPFQSVDASRLYPNTAFHQTLSAVNVRADGTLVGGQHVLVANQNGTGYSLFSNTGTVPLVPDLVQTESMPSYEYQAHGEKLKLQKPQEMQEAVFLTSDGMLNGSVVTTVQQQGLGGWDQAVSDFDGSTVRLQENVAAETQAHISELSAWSTGTPAADGSTSTAQFCPGEPAANFRLPDSLVNFLEDSLNVASTSVDSCTTELPQSGNSSNNMPFDLLTNDDFGRASCNSTGSTLPSSAASSSSYALDNAAALAESPSKFLDNLNTGLLFPVDDGGAPEKSAPNAALRKSTSGAKDHFSSFAFPANDVESKEVTDHKVGERSSQDERPQERLDEPLDTTEQKPTEHDHVRFTSLPDVSDILPDPDGPTADPAETEAIARSCGLQVIRDSDLEEVRELGSGTFGTVYHGKWRGSDVAIKRIKASCFFGSPSEQGRLKDDFWSEACMLAKLHHPNVVAFYGVVPDSPGSTWATVTEFMVNGSLKQVLQRKDSSKVLDRRRRLLIAMDAAFGMEYLHDKRIIHFDLKGENLLVNMRDVQRPVCKVGDLGLSKIKHKTMVSGGVRGTLPWMAPELLNGKSMLVSEKVDVFSFGIVMWELLTGEEPYADLHYGAIIGGIVSNGLRPPIPSYCEPEWKSLMERCWADDPASRPTFTEIANELRGMMAALVKQQQAQAQGQSQQAQGQSRSAQGQQQQAQGQPQQAQGQPQQAQGQQQQSQGQQQQAQGQSQQAQDQSRSAQGQQQQAQGQSQQAQGQSRQAQGQSRQAQGQQQPAQGQSRSAQGQQPQAQVQSQQQAQQQRQGSR